MSMSNFKNDGFRQDIRTSGLNLDDLRLPRAGLQGDEFLPVSSIPETIAVAPFPGVEFPAQNSTTDLMFLRAQFPFNKIMPFPSRAISAALIANTPYELIVPDGAVVGQFSGGGIYYVSRNGNAQIPSASNTAGSMSANDSAVDSLLSPENNLWYLGGIKSFSLIAASNMVVQLLAWKCENWPRR